MPSSLEVKERGSAPDYVETLYGGWRVQPVYSGTEDEDGWCPAEQKRLGLYFPVTCPANGLMHTQWPDPITRRRIRAAYRRWQKNHGRRTSR